MSAEPADSVTEIFISVGRCCCPEQERVVDRFFDFVRKSGLRPLSSSHGDYWPAAGPVEALREVLDRASGTIILALERKMIENGTELRNTKLRDELLPTVWNQVEAGMACGAKHPILILIDRGIRQEGLLDRNFPWHIEVVDLATFDPHCESFARIFASFREQVNKFQQERLIDRPKRRRNENEAVSEIVGSFTSKQIQIILGGLLTLITMVASISFFLGRHMK